MSTRLLVDIHSHVYLPRYVNMLRSRKSVPRIFERTDALGGREDRLLILDHEPSVGRPIGSQYWDRDAKLLFMDKHGIDVSVISSANPWLDFLDPSDAHQFATELNKDLQFYCASAPSVPRSNFKRLYGFGLLPLVPNIGIASLVETVHQIASLPFLKGVIMGTRGIGKGLDDERLEPVWEALAEDQLVVFLHPHYGIDAQHWGDRPNGHVLALALGFPFETAIATTRMILAGIFDRYPTLRVLLAHSGGALPQLSSRLASCIDHDPVVASRLKHDARYYLGNLYFDAVAYGSEELGFVSDVISRAVKFGKDNMITAGKADRQLGSKRMLFGTDHPFFPPLSNSEKWRSVMDNLDAIEGVHDWGTAEKDGVRGLNAVDLFHLTA